MVSQRLPPTGDIKEDVQRASAWAIYNTNDAEDAEKAGCYYCCRIFYPDAIEEWADHGQTVLCPHCGIDSVLFDNSGFPLETSFLQALHKHWFGR